MAASKEYLDYVLDQLSDLSGISYRQMMGEYIIYYNEKIAAYVCDDRFLLKPVKSALELIPDAVMESPYDGAKEMILVDRLDDREFMTRLFLAIEGELQKPKKKTAKKSDKKK